MTLLKIVPNKEHSDQYLIQLTFLYINYINKNIFVNKKLYQLKIQNII